MPVSTAALESEPEPTTKPAVSKFTLNFQLEEAAALDEWVAAARRRVGRRVDKSQVVRALLAELYEDTTLETAIVKRLQRL